MHALFVLIHAVAATVALGAGLVTFRHRAGLLPHVLGVVGMTGALIAAVAAGSHTNPPVTTAIFVGLSAIALTMSGQAVLAWRRRTRGPGQQPLACLRAVGFNCVGLVTGFVAVTATRLTDNGLLITLASAFTVLAGRTVLVRAAPDGSGR